MQKNRRAQRKIGAECLTIGFAVYQVMSEAVYKKYAYHNNFIQIIFLNEIYWIMYLSLTSLCT